MAKRFDISKHFAVKLPERGILSETIHKNDHTALVMMHLAPGEELNEHTSKFPVWIQTIDGEGVLRTPEEEHKMEPGAWIFLDPSEEHAVYPANDQTVTFVLVIMKVG